MHYKNKNLMTAVFLLLSVVFCNELKAQSGWYQLQSGTTSILNSAYFTDAFTGYMVGNNITIKTVNGGYTWQVLPNLGGGSSVYFVNSMTGYVSSNSVFKTTDGGVIWTDLNVSNIKSLYFIDSNTGYGAGSYNKIAKTTNGGASWVTQQTYQANYYLKSVFFTSSQTGYAVGGITNEISSQSLIYKTTNGGNNWVLNSLDAEGVDFSSVFFPVSDTGYIVGGETSGLSGIIYKSFDAGNTWIQQGVTNQYLNSVYFVNARTGYAAGNNGMVIKTVDGSVVWNTQLSNSERNINSIYFVAPDVGFTAGASGSVQKTINGGAEGAPYSISGLINYQTGGPVQSGKVYAIKYLVSQGSIVYVDTAVIQNGTYQLRHVGQDSTYIMAYQDDDEANVNTNLDFVPTFYGDTITWANAHVIYPTGNMTYININVPRINNSGTSTGHIGGGVYAQNINNPLGNARVYARIGNSYINYGTSALNGAYADNFLPQGTYQLICDRFGYRNATKTITLGQVNPDTINFFLLTFGAIGIQNQETNVPLTYKLEQNYPNPFNPSTNIKFDIPVSKSGIGQLPVQLKIYNVLGKEIASVVNESLKPGSYKADWNASNYPSGIYFYRLIVGDISNGGFNETKKMILIK